jgi:hypothetical protein
MKGVRDGGSADTLNRSKTPKATSPSSSITSFLSTTSNTDEKTLTASSFEQDQLISNTLTSTCTTSINNSSNRNSKNKKKKSRSNDSTFQLNTNQILALLKPFWKFVLQNDLKQVRKFLLEYVPSRIDLNLYRSSANSDGTALHLCAQMGFIQMADLLLDQGKIQLNSQNKVSHCVCLCHVLYCILNVFKMLLHFSWV